MTIIIRMNVMDNPFYSTLECSDQDSGGKYLTTVGVNHGLSF